jgi:hypothetical protein
MAIFSFDPFTPVSISDAYIPDRLIAGDLKLVTQNIDIAAGQVLFRGSVMGRTTGTITSAPGGSNVGTGTVSALAIGAASQPGAFVLTATSATSFNVTAPNGAVLAVATVGQPYESEAIGFVINAGGTAFAVGDTFTVTVSATGGTYLLAVSTASDGSQNPVGILVNNIDTSSTGLNAQAQGAIYVMGEFNANALSFGAGFDAASVRDALAARSIHIKFPVSAAQIVD